MTYEPHYTPDMSAELDSPESILADELGISIPAARKVQRLIRRNADPYYRILPMIHDIVARMPDTIDKWGIAFAVMSPETAGRSMADIAAQIGVSRAAISHKAKEFCDMHGIDFSKLNTPTHDGVCT